MSRFSREELRANWPPPDDACVRCRKSHATTLLVVNGRQEFVARAIRRYADFDDLEEARDMTRMLLEEAGEPGAGDGPHGISVHLCRECAEEVTGGRGTRLAIVLRET